jgi:hypothetical protein
MLYFLLTGSKGAGEASERENTRGRGRSEAFQGEHEAGKDFFIWIRRNPLKSPDSAKGIQGNPSFFVWIYLD